LTTPTTVTVTVSFDPRVIRTLSPTERFRSKTVRARSLITISRLPASKLRPSRKVAPSNACGVVAVSCCLATVSPANRSALTATVPCGTTLRTPATCLTCPRSRSVNTGCGESGKPPPSSAGVERR
jgi:hypothetical protein